MDRNPWMNGRQSFWGASIVAILAISCRSKVPQCVPGSTIECPCLGAAKATQTCEATGTFAACSCPSSTAASSVGTAARSHPCDASGKWIFTATFTKGGVCGGKKSYSDQLTVVRSGSRYEIRGRSASWGGTRLDVQDENGACVVTLSESINLIASGTPDVVEVALKLRELDGRVTGTGTFDDIDDDKPYEKNLSRCTEGLTVLGTKTSVAEADLGLDKKAVRRDLSTFLELARDRCELPALTEGATGPFKVALTLAADGGLTALKIDGVDQKYDQNCDALLSENRLQLFMNPTGTRQVVSFSKVVAQKKQLKDTTEADQALRSLIRE